MLFILAAARQALALEALRRQGAPTVLTGLAAAVLLAGQAVLASASGLSTTAAALASVVAALLLAADLWSGRLAHATVAWGGSSGSPAQPSPSLPALGALLRLDGLVCVLLCSVCMVNGASPASNWLLPLLLAAGAGGLPLQLALLALLARGAARGWQACAQVLAALPPLLAIFEALRSSSRLSQAHGQASLIFWALAMVATRAATWYEAAAAAAALEPTACRSSGTTQLPASLLPLVAGTWLLKYPPSGKRRTQLWSIPAAVGERGCGGSSAVVAGGRWRYFRLSADGAMLTWGVDGAHRKSVLLAACSGISCSESHCSIRLHMALEPDLVLGGWEEGGACPQARDASTCQPLPAPPACSAAQRLHPAAPSSLPHRRRLRRLELWPRYAAAPADAAHPTWRRRCRAPRGAGHAGGGRDPACALVPASPAVQQAKARAGGGGGSPQPHAIGAGAGS